MRLRSEEKPFNWKLIILIDTFREKSPKKENISDFDISHVSREWKSISKTLVRNTESSQSNLSVDKASDILGL